MVEKRQLILDNFVIDTWACSKTCVHEYHICPWACIMWFYLQYDVCIIKQGFQVRTVH